MPFGLARINKVKESLYKTHRSECRRASKHQTRTKLVQAIRSDRAARRAREKDSCLASVYSVFSISVVCASSEPTRRRHSWSFADPIRSHPIVASLLFRLNSLRSVRIHLQIQDQKCDESIIRKEFCGSCRSEEKQRKGTRAIFGLLLRVVSSSGLAGREL